MLRQLNFLAFIAASAYSAIQYVKSVSPAQMEAEKVPDPYQLCRRYRMGSLVAMLLAMVFFIASRYVPLANFMAAPFRWPRWLSFILAMLLGIPGLSLAITGLQDLGSESYTPAKANKLKTRGIYQKIRHPQAYEALLWPAIALGLNSPLLLALSVPWVLIEVIMVMAEETDLVIRFGQPYIKYRARTGMFFPKGNLDFLDPIKDLIASLFKPNDE